MLSRDLAPGEETIIRNAMKDPTYSPYCGRCYGLHRMSRVEPFLWQHSCGAVHDSRGTMIVQEHLAALKRCRLSERVDTMSNDQEKPNPKKGLLVEDETVVGGTDATTGAPVIKPKTSDGRADESVKPTDSREKGQ